MPKNKNSDSALLPFHALLAGTLSTGVASANLNPTGISARVLTEADGWAHFRVKSLKFRLHPAASTAGGDQAIGYVGGVQDTLPGSVAQLADLIPSVHQSQNSTVPSDWVNVPSADLAGPLPWYKTIPGTADSTEEAPGVIRIAGSGSDTYAAELRGVIEFKTSVATANTPAEAKLLSDLRALRAAKAAQMHREAIVRAFASPTGLPLPK